MANGGVHAAHTIQPVEVHVNGDKAISESTGSISIRFTLNDEDYDCVSYTRFISRLQRVESEWKMLTLEAVYERDSIVPVTPVPPSIGNPKLISTSGRDSYRWIGWLLSRKGFQIDPNLPARQLKSLQGYLSIWDFLLKPSWEYKVQCST
ncbi:unnamed protein product [Penicillium pancosmium]